MHTHVLNYLQTELITRLLSMILLHVFNYMFNLLFKLAHALLWTFSQYHVKGVCLSDLETSYSEMKHMVLLCCTTHPFFCFYFSQFPNSDRLKVSGNLILSWMQLSNRCFYLKQKLYLDCSQSNNMLVQWLYYYRLLYIIIIRMFKFNRIKWFGYLFETWYVAL